MLANESDKTIGTDQHYRYGIYAEDQHKICGKVEMNTHMHSSFTQERHEGFVAYLIPRSWMRRPPKAKDLGEGTNDCQLLWTSIPVVELHEPFGFPCPNAEHTDTTPSLNHYGTTHETKSSLLHILFSVTL
jgi:hypothetical protein